MTLTEDRTTRVTVEDGIASIVIDRPPLNVLNIATLHDLDRALLDLEGRHDLRLVTLRGAGRVFSAGVDVAEHRGDLLVPLLDAFARVAERLLSYPIPTFAIVQGAALGGACELVALCDLALAADEAKIGTPEITLGVVPPVGAAIFPSLVGRQRAAALILTGVPIDGRKAAAWGLIWRSVPSSDLEQEASFVLASFRGMSAASLRLAKETLRLAADRDTPLDAMQAADAEQRRVLPRTADADEGLRAFLEKRAPVWRHR